MVRRAIRKLFWLVLLGVSATSAASTTSWTISLNNTLNTFTGSESVNSVSISGTITRPSTGFVRMVVTSSSGTGAPALNAVKYLIEVPGLVTIVEPLLTSETDLIYLVESGSCPTTTQNSIWIFGHWDRGGLNNMTSTSQPAFGTATYTPGTPDNFTLNQVYEVHTGAAISGFGSFSLTGTCASGQVPISGAGDRGGTVYVTANGGTFFRTNGNKGVLAIPQVRLTYGQNELTGSYSGFRYTSTSSPDIRPMRMTVTADGWSASGNGLLDPNDGTTDPSFAETLDITAMNDPVEGMVRGTITRGGDSGNVSCAAMATDRNVLFCAGQSPDANATPFNLVLVSDAFRFTKGVGAAGLEIRDVVYDSASGKTYVAGNFTTYRGAAASYLIRLNSDDTLDTSFNVGEGFDSSVFSVALANDGSNDVYAGGAFTSYDGNAAQYVVRLNSDGSYDSGFDTNPGFDQYVYKVAVATDGSNDLYVGGYFEAYGASNARKIARLNSDGSLDSGFAVGTAFGTGYKWVQALLPRSDGDLYVGGLFNSFDGTSNINNIVRLNSNGTRDTGFAIGSGANAGFDQDVNDIVQATDGSNDIYVGGWFTEYKGSPTNCSRIARLNSDGTFDSGFATADGLEPYSYAQTPYVNKILIMPAGSPGTSANDIVVLGEFAMAQDVARSRWARFNTDGSLDTQLGNGDVGHWAMTGAVIGTSGDIWVGGRFRGLGNLSVGNLLRINYLGQMASGFTDYGPNGFDSGLGYYSLAPANDGTHDIFVGGPFDLYNNSLIRNIARMNRNGTIDFSFDSSLDSWSYGANTLKSVAVTADGSKVYAYGDVTLIEQPSGSYTVGYIARFHSSGLIDTAFAAGTGFDTSPMNVVPVSDGDVYAVGSFTTYNGTSANGIVRLNSNGSIDSGFAYGTGFTSGSDIRSLAFAADGSGKIYVGGDFTTYKGSGYNRIIRLNTDGSVDSGFSMGTGFDATVANILPLADGDVYVCGYFTTYNGSSVGQVVRLNSNGSLDTAFDTSVSFGFNNDVLAMALANDSSGDIYVGGGFTTYRGVAARRIARLNSDGTADGTFAPGDAFNGRVFSLLSKPNDTTGQVYAAGDFTAFDGYGANYIARITATGASD